MAVMRTPAKPITQERLDAAALFYLERFATSSANLKSVLMRRIRRSARDHGTDPGEGAAWIDALIQRYLATGLLDDRAYAATKAASLHRRGASARAIAAKLAGKGVPRELVAASLGEADDESGYAARPGGDLAAAAALARRKRLGRAIRAEHRQKDLGTLARAGFSRAIAERVLDCADPNAVAALLQD